MVAELTRTAHTLAVDTILHGDALSTLRTLPSESVHCVVTSPPYFGQRDYGVAGQLGLEETPADYIANMVAIFAEVRRVLRSDGVCWVNIGDSYANNASTSKIPRAEQGNGTGVFRIPGEEHVQARRQKPNRLTSMRHEGLKQKDLVGIPWMLAFALRDDGWYLRSDCIWHKPNAMPESVRDRPSMDHEHVFLLAKSGTRTFWSHRDGYGSRVQPRPDYRWVHRETGEERAEPQRGSEWKRVNLWMGEDYYYDADAIREPHRSLNRPPGNKSRAFLDRDPKHHTGEKRRPGLEQSYHAAGRNKRTVWTVATAPYKGAHFATFPPALIEPCVLAGASPRVCERCGAPWRRQVERTFIPQPDVSRERSIHRPESLNASSGWVGFPRGSTLTRTLGWLPTCRCAGALGSARAVVLDPFMGVGTTAVVARQHSRHYLGIELSAEYIAQAEARIAATLQPVLWSV